ncbi:MAG: large repetitive protein [Acidobacteriota bacterium]|jgi:uncharacterized repeat protein (TIGR01451 family)|nr:large repetitive protein [Acidobacteriota bacterium]
MRLPSRTLRSLLLILFIVAVSAVAALPGSSSARAKKNSPPDNSSKAVGVELAAPVEFRQAAPSLPVAPRLKTAGLGFTPLAVFQVSFADSVSTFDADCTTPKVSWTLGNEVCVKVSGPLDASNVLRRLRLVNPAGLVVGSVDVTTNPQTVTFTLPSNATTTFNGLLNPGSDTSIDNRGTWQIISTNTSDGSVAAFASITVHDPVKIVADLQISKSLTEDSTATAGANIKSVIWVFNAGPDDAQNVSVSDATPANTTFQSLIQTAGPTFTCTTPAVNSVGTSVCQPDNMTKSLAKGDAAGFIVTYKVSSSIANGSDLSSTASVTSSTEETNAGNNSSDETVPASNPTTPTCSITCPANITQTAATGQSGAIVTFNAPTGVGSCGTQPATTSPASGSFFSIGTSVVTTTTETGQSCSFTVTVNPAVDNEAPSISCPSDISVPESSSSSNSANVSYSVTANDNSGTADITCNPPSGSSFPVGTHEVICTATDPAGNSASCTFNVTVTDVGCNLDASSAAPVPNVMSLPTITRACSVTLLAADDPTATDACGGTVSGETSDRTYDAPGTYPVVWTYTDSAGHTTTQNQTIVILPDTSAPVPDAASLPTVTGECSAAITGDPPTATDNCGGSGIVGTPLDPLSYNTPGTHVVRWKFTDAANNSTIQNQTVIVTDSAPPVPNVVSLPTLTGECSVTVTPPTATDNCAGTVTATTTDPTTYTADGTYTVHWTYTDAANNTATQNQTVIVDDTTAPVPNVASLPALTGECSVTALAPTATDNCAGTITATTGDPTTYTAQGTYIIHWTYSDGRGNSSTQNQTVVVHDNTPPTITAPVAKTLYTGAGATSCGVTVSNLDATFGTATANDNCSVASVVRTGVPAGGVFPLGQTTLIYTVTDVGGNTASATQVVTVVDNTPPTLVVPNVSVYLPLNSTATSMAVNYPAATTGDNCSGTVSVVYTPASGSVFPVGTSTVSATATDAHGNTTTQTFTVTVLYNFTGFFSPVSNAPTLNVVNAGRAVPVKFSLSGNKGLSIFAVNSPSSGQVTCGTSTQSDVQDTTTAGSSSLSYDAGSSQYNYVWKTESSWAGQCRVLNVTLNDGTVHTALFKFK